ncbi:hypothetical protein DFH09DRAFT_1089783 [Mycena vulgaris]|nr:hypothetical protein DFH09DRAFT_1089783 [Mycena vulgaris]
MQLSFQSSGKSVLVYIFRYGTELGPAVFADWHISLSTGTTIVQRKVSSLEDQRPGEERYPKTPEPAVDCEPVATEEPPGDVLCVASTVELQTYENSKKDKTLDCNVTLTLLPRIHNEKHSMEHLATLGSMWSTGSATRRARSESSDASRTIADHRPMNGRIQVLGVQWHRGYHDDSEALGRNRETLGQTGELMKVEEERGCHVHMRPALGLDSRVLHTALQAVSVQSRWKLEARQHPCDVSLDSVLLRTAPRPVLVTQTPNCMGFWTLGELRAVEGSMLVQDVRVPIK